MQFHQTTLENGLDIVAEINPQAHSAAVGFFVKTGSRDEHPEVSGVSHFLEHMAFKGDEKFTADDVNRIFDEVGASYNASTSEEVTLYYAAILPEYLDHTFELLASMMRPSLREDDFNVEKRVILEEIGMYEDMPAFSLYEKAMQLHFRKHPLGQSILGTTDSITALSAQQMRDYHSQRYGAGNLVLAATGNLDWDQLNSLAKTYCSHWNTGTPGRIVEEATPEPAVSWLQRKEMHQQHVMLMSAAPPTQSPLRYAAEMAAMIVGDDGIGRIYWELVETGLAETADLAYNDLDGSGIWMSYLCCQPEDAMSNLERIAAICDEFNRNGPTEEELELARNKVASRIVLAGERPMGRLSSLGGNWLYRREYRSIKDDLDAIRSVTLEEIRSLLDQYPIRQTTTIGLGPLAG